MSSNRSARALSRLTTSIPLLLGAGALVMAACVGDDPGVGGGSSGTTVTDPDGGATTNDGAVSNGDSATGTDSSTSSCSCVDTGASLRCGAMTTACDYGCAEPTADTPAHCRRFDPTGIVDPTDLTVAGLKDYKGKNFKFFTDTGQITSADGATEIRGANQFPEKEEVNAAGIGFRRVAGKVGIFQFKNLTIEKADAFSFNGAIGAVALALVATEQITISGRIDLGCTTYGQLYGYSAAGSSPGGTSVNNTVSGDGTGPGKGKGGGVASGLAEGGGGGGGHGALGGFGGDGLNTVVASGGQAGASYADPGFDPPLGGSGGGSGATASGGAGGGAVQLVAGTKITIGSGTGVANASGLGEGINVGGCGGGSGLNGPSGGGGSGGTILIEAPVVVGLANAGLASNGGSGGGGASDSAQNGVISSSVPGPATNVCYGGGGNGGAGTSPSGGSGMTGTATAACSSTTRSYGGGGGGAAGFVRILTKSGDITADASFLISPSLAPALQKGKISTR